MDKRVLQTFAVWAKDNLEQQIEVSLKTLGINNDNDFRKAQRRGEYTIIDGDANSYSSDLFEKRNQIINQVTQKGYKNLIEEVAYTWFNRLVALRFIELHNFLPHGFRVLSSTNGSVEPDILKNLNLVKDDLRLNIDKCEKFKGQNKIEELFRYVLIQQCNALSDVLPMLFSWDLGYMELLLPKSMLIGETILTRLVEIPEDNFKNDVEIIGWMYQFYISAKKDAVNSAKKTITKDTLPAVTQLFTPDWIVRYMAENSVGRIWMESYPQSQLRRSMNYYVDDPEQMPEVQKKLDEIKYKNVEPENIHIIEPCSGSGHILVYVMELLYKMYEEKGYNRRDIPTLILKNNLVGLDVDKRASQLASFALIMKARTLNNRFFRKEYYILPRVYELQDSHEMEALDYKNNMKGLKEFSDAEINTVCKLVDTFENGKTIGSLIKVPALDYSIIENVIDKLEQNKIPTMFGANFVTQLKILLNQANVLSEKYDVMITNPPYISPASMDDSVKIYANKMYPSSKTDMFAMFMETDLVKPNGFTAMINMHSWMFISSYDNLRRTILSTKHFNTMIHLGTHAFDTIGGEKVQTTSFVMRSCPIGGMGVYHRLVMCNDKEQGFLEGDGYRFIYDQRKYGEISGSPIAYWISNSIRSAYRNGLALGKIAAPRKGCSTSKNSKFLRLWFEVSLTGINLNAKTIDAKESCVRRWYPYNKGGGYRKWYGNNEYLIDWFNDAAEIRSIKTSVIANYQYFCVPGLTWSTVSREKFSIRWFDEGFIFDNGGCCIFELGDKRPYIIALLNSSIFKYIFGQMNPTMNFQSGEVAKFPVLYAPNMGVEALAMENVSISKEDWDSFETSWGFSHHPLVLQQSEKAKFVEENKDNIDSVAWHYTRWAKECQKRFDNLKTNEKEINRIFIDIYGLQNEMTSEVNDTDITVRLADRERDIKSLISYLVGVVMGRYSLDTPRIVYAGGEWDSSLYRTYQPDDDGIVPIYRGIGMENGLTAQLFDLIKLIYGNDSYRKNIDFIAESLGRKSNESSEETLNRYLNDGFFADHLKIYQKCPIYWLFSSGKNSGFKCLVYMHRYTSETLARINSRYFLPESTRLKNDLEELVGRLAKANGREQVRLEKERQKLAAAYNEAIEYGQVLDYMANQYIEIDLDDGVINNYAKFQNVEMVSDSGNKVMKNLLASIE